MGMSEFPLAPESPIGNPAPFWFVLTFKVFGFVLHIIPMHLWYAGLLLIVIFSFRRQIFFKLLAERLLGIMPFAIAIGINFGIIPLLFIQVGYYPVFYPSTILMSWFWLAVIPLLMTAYYGVYFYLSQVRREKMSWPGRMAGVISSGCFLLIGFIFANQFSLMVNPHQMLSLYDRFQWSGAPNGLGLNLWDATLWPRWLMMFGLALLTTAVYITLDAVFFVKGQGYEYRLWQAGIGFKVYTFGMIVFVLMGSWYLFGSLPGEILKTVLSDFKIASLMLLTAVSPGVVWLAVYKASRFLKSFFALLALVGQLGVLILNALSRQWVQNQELLPFFNPSKLKVVTQWSPMIVFLSLFAVGIVIIAWMLVQWLKAYRSNRS